MQTIKQLVGYLSNLEWTERFQHICTFCDRANFASIVYEDDQIVVIDNRRRAGQMHWLIMPKLHLVRDIENLNATHLDLLHSMNEVKHRLLQERCLGISSSAIHSGYHRGRRPLIGSIFYPDIVSVHHLHLHVIIRPHLLLLWIKYPPWLPLMWKSDDKVLQEIEKLSLKDR
ncbi:HIT-like domain-containing protein [Trichoderma ceciliae]